MHDEANLLNVANAAKGQVESKANSASVLYAKVNEKRLKPFLVELVKLSEEADNVAKSSDNTNYKGTAANIIRELKQISKTIYGSYRETKVLFKLSTKAVRANNKAPRNTPAASATITKKKHWWN